MVPPVQLPSFKSSMSEKRRSRISLENLSRHWRTWRQSHGEHPETGVPDEELSEGYPNRTNPSNATQQLAPVQHCPPDNGCCVQCHHRYLTVTRLSDLKYLQRFGKESLISLFPTADLDSASANGIFGKFVDQRDATCPSCMALATMFDSNPSDRESSWRTDCEFQLTWVPDWGPNGGIRLDSGIG